MADTTNEIRMQTLEDIYGRIPIHNGCFVSDCDSTPIINNEYKNDIGNLDYSHYSLANNYFHVVGKQIDVVENGDYGNAGASTAGSDVIFSYGNLNVTYDEATEWFQEKSYKSFKVFNGTLAYVSEYWTQGTVPDDNSQYRQWKESFNTTVSAYIITNENYEILKTYPSKFDTIFAFCNNGTIQNYTDGMAKVQSFDGSSNPNWTFKPAYGAIELANKTSIVNFLVGDNPDGDINIQILALANDLMNNLNGTNPDILTDGKLKNEPIEINGMQVDRWRWEGNKILDQLIYTLQSNLDILHKEYNMKSDVLASTYATLYQASLSAAIQYQNALISSKTQLIAALSGLTKTSMENLLAKVQSKWYHVQMEAFRANNDQKLFAAQYEGASTSFSAGMVDYAPMVNNDQDLMTLYGKVRTMISGV